MAVMKRVLVSLGIGLAIPALLILVMIGSKILNGPEWMSIVLSVLAWPLPVFVRWFPGMSQLSLGLFSFLLGAFLDVVITSFLTDAVLRFLRAEGPSDRTSTGPSVRP